MSTGRHTRQVLIGSTETRILLGKRRPVSGECESGLTIFDCTHAVLILVVRLFANSVRGWRAMD